MFYATSEQHVCLLHNAWSEAGGLFLIVSLCGLSRLRLCSFGRLLLCCLAQLLQTSSWRKALFDNGGT